MELYYSLIVLGLASLGAPFLAKLAGYETHRKPLDLVGAGGIFFLLSAALTIAGSLHASLAGMCHIMMMGSFIIGMLGLLIGAFWTAHEVLHESDHGMVTKM